MSAEVADESAVEQPPIRQSTVQITRRAAPAEMLTPDCHDLIGDADEVDAWPVRQVLIPAAGRPAPCSRAPASVWAAAQAASKALQAAGRFGDAAGFEVGATAAAPVGPRPIVHRFSAVTRCCGSRYPEDRWTSEKAEQEAARRGRQRPPPPPKGARTRGKKLRASIGSRLWDDGD